MDEKPIHYDGSVQLNESIDGDTMKEPFELTEEMRASLSGNPFMPANGD